MKCTPSSASIPASIGKPSLQDRPLIDSALARDLARLFKVLSNDTRLRLLHALARAGELCVTDICAAVKMAPQAVSNQLQRLADRQIVIARREGNRLFYTLADPCIPGLLDLGFCLLEETRKSRASNRARKERR
jgi:DNA-binding transcriptional ArsR family regulator